MNRWKLGKSGIIWNVKTDHRLPHMDHVEMSGQGSSVCIDYGVNGDRLLQLSARVVFPTLRTIPNNTHACLILNFSVEFAGKFTVDEKALQEKVESIEFDGMLSIHSRLGENLLLTRTIYPAKTSRAIIQKLTFQNCGNKAVQISGQDYSQQLVRRGCEGIYLVDLRWDFQDIHILESGQKYVCSVCITGRKRMEAPVVPDVEEEEKKRRGFFSGLRNNLQLVTPDPVINQAFDFAKLHVCENVFRTKAGLMHSPGGHSFYAAIWANDEIEYAGPMAPYIGEPDFLDASLNAYRLYYPFMGPDYTMIPSSIIAEGQDIWEGAGDRGDAAMYAYGGAHFALACGKKKIAEEMYPAIQWALEYCSRHKNESGVIESDSDELEGRFPSGNANLSTSCLYYGGLMETVQLARELGDNGSAEKYHQEAQELHKAINQYFGAEVEGYACYQYYQKNDMLRSWICLPLVMGIDERKEGTIQALLSDRLWTDEGLLTQSGTSTYWDRSTLYGLRGILSVESNRTVMHYLKAYTDCRTLGEHVPYAIEAYPEGNQRQLSSESALYCRIFTEGLLGIRPMGMHSFVLHPNLPEDWAQVELRNIKAFDRDFSIRVMNQTESYAVTVLQQDSRKVFEIPKGTDFTVNL